MGDNEVKIILMSSGSNTPSELVRKRIERGSDAL